MGLGRWVEGEHRALGSGTVPGHTRQSSVIGLNFSLLYMDCGCYGTHFLRAASLESNRFESLQTGQQANCCCYRHGRKDQAREQKERRNQMHHRNARSTPSKFEQTL